MDRNLVTPKREESEVTIQWTDRFRKKAQTQDYPLRGFYFQVVGGGGIREAFDTVSSSIYKCNTYITEGRLQFSINLVGTPFENSNIKSIYLYALDRIILTNDYQFTSEKDPMLFYNLAGVVRFGEGVVWDRINIFDTAIYKDTDEGNLSIELIDHIKLRCDFDCIGGSEDAGATDSVSHFDSMDMGQSNIVNAKSDSELISKNSAIYRLKSMIDDHSERQWDTFRIPNTGLMEY